MKVNTRRREEIAVNFAVNFAIHTTNRIRAHHTIYPIGAGESYTIGR
jgi:hypothetical protein